MIDKVQKIKEWIKEKIACWCNESQCEVPELPKQIIEGKILALREMLSFINSLQEEPISEDLKEAANAESLKWVEGHSFSYRPWLRQCFINGAKWHKQRLMKDAIEYTIIEQNELSTEVATFPPNQGLGKIREGDSVKIIIVKEN